MKIKQKVLTKEEKEDLKNILSSEDEGFGMISEGYRCRDVKVEKRLDLVLRN